MSTPHGFALIANAATNYRFQITIRHSEFTFELAYSNSVLFTLFHLPIEECEDYDPYVPIPYPLLYFRLNSFQFAGGNFLFFSHTICLTIFSFAELDQLSNIFIIKIFKNGIISHEYRFARNGFAEPTTVSDTPSRRRRVRANMAAANEDNSSLSGSATTLDLTSEPQQSTTNACFICTNEFAFAERVVCPGCSNFLCLQCYANMERVAMGRNVNCPFCRRRLLTNSADDGFDVLA